MVWPWHYNQWIWGTLRKLLLCAAFNVKAHLAVHAINSLMVERIAFQSHSSVALPEPPLLAISWVVPSFWADWTGLEFFHLPQIWRFHTALLEFSVVIRRWTDSVFAAYVIDFNVGLGFFKNRYDLRFAKSWFLYVSLLSSFSQKTPVNTASCFGKVRVSINKNK